MNKKAYAFVIALAIISGAAAGMAVEYLAFAPEEKTTEDLIKEYYEVENSVLVSPHSLRKKMSAGEDSFILVDLRSQQEYEKEHILGAVNIPAYSSPDKSDYGAVDRIVGSFKELKESNPGKNIIVYCYSLPCMTGRKIGLMLVDYDIYVKHLGIGWNEWKYSWDSWNHDSETPVNPNDYVISGSEPGFLNLENSLGACSLGGFGC